MKNKKALIMLMLLSVNVFSQEFDDIMINPFWSFYSENYLDAVSSGKGNTGIGSLGSISAVYLNPAAINIPGKYQADIQYTYRSNQNWLPSLHISDLYLTQNPYSGSVGFGLRISKNFQTGLLYGNPNSLTLNIGEIIITNEFGEEIGRYNAYEKYIVHSFSVPLVYSTENFRIGLNLNYSLHRRYATFENDEFEGKFDKFNIHAGVIFQPSKQLTIGASFIPQVTGEVTGNSSVFFNEVTKATIPMKRG